MLQHEHKKVFNCSAFIHFARDKIYVIQFPVCAIAAVASAMNIITHCHYSSFAPISGGKPQREQEKLLPSALFRSARLRSAPPTKRQQQLHFVSIFMFASLTEK